MAENVVINIEANTSGLTETINLLTKLGVVEKSVADEFQKTNAANVASIQKGVQGTTKEFEKLDKAVKGLKADNGLAKSLDVSKEITQVGNSFQTLRSQFKEATIEAQNLAEQFGELDPRTLAAAKRAAELKDTIGDVNAQIAALTPEGKFQAIQNLGGAIAGVFQVATGALQAFGVESEQATKIAQQFQGALNIFGGLSQLTQLKDQLTAVKTAFGLTTTATKGAKDAQDGLNKSILSNPYVLAAAAIIAITVALVAFSDDAEEAAAKAKALNDELDSTAAGYKGYIAALDRGTKKRISDIDTEIKLLELQGGKTKEIGDLRLQRIETEKKGILDLIDANEKLNDNQATAANEYIKSTDEETRKRGFALQKEIVDRTAANKDLQAQVYILNNNRRQLEAETTATLKKEEEQRVKDANEAADKRKAANFDTQLKAIEESYDKQRLEEQKLFETKEDFAQRGTEITAKEIEAKIELYKKFNKSTVELEQQLLDLRQASSKGPSRDFAKEQKDAFANASGLIDQYYNEQELAIRNSGKTQDEIAEELAANDKARLEEKIKAGKAYYQDTTQMENQLAGVKATNSEKELKAIEDSKKKLQEYKDELKDTIKNVGFDIVGQQLDNLFENSINRINEQKDAQLEAISEEEEALQESYDNRLIGKRNYELQQEALEKKRIDAALVAERKLAAERKKADLARRAIALFQIFLSTRQAYMAALSDPTLIGPARIIAANTVLIQGGLQAAAVLAQPLPKYKKGTLSVNGVGSDDSQLALLQPGEAVIPTETNRKYHPAIKAIYHNKIRPEDINAFVKMRLKGEVGSHAGGPVTAKMDIADIYALGRIIKKNDGVTIKNVKELASIFADNYNPRR